MRTHTAVHVTSATDEVTARLGGTVPDIPTLTFGGLDVVINPQLLSPSEQAAWLRRLIAAAEDLIALVDVSASAGVS